MVQFGTILWLFLSGLQERLYQERSQDFPGVRPILKTLPQLLAQFSRIKRFPITFANSVN